MEYCTQKHILLNHVIAKISGFCNIDSADPLEYGDYYFNLKFALEDLLKRQIDLLENKAISNSYLRESIDKSKTLLYAS